MSGLAVDTGVLAGCAGELARSASELGSSLDRGVDLASAVGDRDLGAVVGDFAAAWAGERAAVVNELRAVADALARAAEVLAAAEGDVTSAFSGFVVGGVRRTGFAPEAV